MTFTYSDSAPWTDLVRVRFHTGDVSSDNPWFQDEEITAMLTEFGSWQEVVINSLEQMKLRVLRAPASSMQRGSTVAMVEQLEKILRSKRRAFGMNVVSGGVVHPYRVDSAASEEPDYTGGVPGNVED
jgi:hypothetical protein